MSQASMQQGGGTEATAAGASSSPATADHAHSLTAALVSTGLDTAAAEEPATVSAAAPAESLKDNTDSMLKCLEREMHVRHHRRGTRPLAQLESKAKQLTDAGELYKAYPIWCEVAHCACTQQGANSPAAVTAMQQVVHIGAQQGTCMPGYVVWLLGRADGRLDDPAMQRLVRRAALSLATCENPRNHTWFTGKVIELVQQLPGGLGWGSTVVAPVPDEEAYARHVFMQRRAFAMVPQPGAGPAEYALARKMLERCIAYYDTLGQHWLGSARRVQCMNRLVINTLHGGAGTAAAVAAALPLSLQAKRVATRELGPQHSTTLGVMWVYAFILGAQGRTETCHSLLHNTLKQRQEVEGVHHADAVFDKLAIAEALMQASKCEEAEALMRDTIEGCVRVHGPRGDPTRMALRTYWHLMQSKMCLMGSVMAMKERARRLGCDMSGWGQ